MSEEIWIVDLKLSFEGSTINEHLATIVVGAVQLVSNIAALFVVDKAGRKPLLLTSAIIMCLSMASMGTAFYLNQNDVNEFGCVKKAKSTRIIRNVSHFSFSDSYRWLVWWSIWLDSPLVSVAFHICCWANYFQRNTEAFSARLPAHLILAWCLSSSKPITTWKRYSFCSVQWLDA